MKYDYLIVGAGFFGATFARLMTDAGKKCLIIDSRKHIGGNAYTERRNGIDVHMYGPHIFHTNDNRIWKFVNQFSEFNNFILSPKAYVNGRMYSLPFNMNTFHEVWKCITPNQAKKIIESQKFHGKPQNLEEQAISMVGVDIYNLLIKGYTEKQWKKDCKELPASIIKRLPLRFTYDNNYFNDTYQGIPTEGYTRLFERMLEGIEVTLSCNYFENKDFLSSIANRVVFTGKIDEFFDYKYGELEYRTLDFEHQELKTDNYQGCAVVNYPDLSAPYTRIIEHKHFTKANTDTTIITKEIPTDYHRDRVPYYPINDDRNTAIFNKYRKEADSLENVIFGGRLAEYRYYDMHQIIGSAMTTVKTELYK
jgi:UDP-galactopyranose mutase